MGAAGGALGLGQLEDLHPIDAAEVGEEEQLVVHLGNEDLGGLVLVLGAAGLDPDPAAALGAVGLQGGALDEAGGGHSDHHGLVVDQVLGVKALGEGGDHRAPGVAELLLHRQELVLDHPPEPALVLEDGLEVGDLLLQLPVLGLEAFALEPHQALQAHVEDGLGLDLGQGKAGHQPPAGLGSVLGGADQGDDLVDVVEGDQQPLEHVGPLLGLS